MAEQSTALYVRLPPKLRAELQAMARRRDTNMTYEATVAIRAHVDADKQRRAGR